MAENASVESERAFLKAFVVGTVTTISVWAVLLYFVHPVVDELIGYAIFVVVTLAIVVPVLYRRYLQEGKPKQDPTPNRLRFAGGLYIVLSLAYVSDILFDDRHHDRWYVVS